MLEIETVHFFATSTLRDVEDSDRYHLRCENLKSHTIFVMAGATVTRWSCIREELSSSVH